MKYCHLCRDVPQNQDATYCWVCGNMLTDSEEADKVAALLQRGWIPPETTKMIKEAANDGDVATIKRILAD